jgi:hypothetical protein
MAAISYVLRLIDLGHLDFSTKPPMKTLLKAIKKINTNTPDTRSPITLGLLRQLTMILDHSAPFSRYMCTMYIAMYTLMVFALLRVGEVTCTNQNLTSNIIMREAITKTTANARGPALLLTLRNFEHSTGHATQIVLCKELDTRVCPVAALMNYLALGGDFPGALFLNECSMLISRNKFVSHLNTLLGMTEIDVMTTTYKCHSFRIGGACLAAERGYSDAQIRRLGRWKSDAFKKYLRAFTVSSVP